MDNKGAVVTGTAISGIINTDDPAQILGAQMNVRIRGIHAQNTKVELGKTGQRCALNLAGPNLDKKFIRRGDWIVNGDVPPPTLKIDIRLSFLSSEKKVLAHWTPVHVHLGAAETTGRVALLGSEKIKPGETGLAQLVLNEPIGAAHGDGLILRDQSAKRTIGGGKVIDVFPPKRGRARKERIAFLEAMEEADDGIALTNLLNVSPMGIDLRQFASNRNLTNEDVVLLKELVVMKTVETNEDIRVFSDKKWSELRNTVLETLASWHKKFPDTVGPAENRLLTHTGLRFRPAMATAIAGEFLKEGLIIKEGMGIRLPTHQPILQGTDAKNWRKIKPLLYESSLRPPVISEIANKINGDVKKIESLLVRAGRQGLVIRVAKNRFYLPDTLHELANIAAEISRKSKDGMITASEFRDATNIGRNLTIEILEFFNKVKFTRRIGDSHEIISSTDIVFDSK